MTRYTVTYSQDALQALARLWLSASDRRAVTRAGDAIEVELGVDAPIKGCPASSEFRQLIIAPLVIEYTVKEDDRIVTIWSVRHVGELTNGL